MTILSRFSRTAAVLLASLMLPTVSVGAQQQAAVVAPAPSAVPQPTTLQPDGRILVGGTFTGVQPVGTSERTSRSNILRLNSTIELNDPLQSKFDAAKE